ncbi:helix-turn-helix transcriptional regulator [Lentzea sp.]|uniref:helix-turn-helix transcriptional regulator n=1 Tax=Lentzea sp. TaxID=56099 RepID=UPI002ED45B79
MESFAIAGEKRMNNSGAASAVESARRLFADCAAARRLCEEVAADRDTARVVAVSGPGGTGKSTLLGVLSSMSAGAVLVDDAHELDESEVTRLARTATDNHSMLVVAHRPWPVVTALSGLPWTQQPIRLEPLSRASTAQRIAALVPTDPPDDLVDLVWRQTGGMPSLVVRVAEALRDGAPVPRDVTDQVQRMVDRAPAEALHVLAAVALGCETAADPLGAVLDMPGPEVSAAVECARATGLLDSAGTVIELAVRPVLHRLPATRRREIEEQVALTRLDHGASVVEAGRLLLECGARGSRAASALEAAGDEVRGDDPALAAELYSAAVDAGASAPPLAARRAEAAALAGDFDVALALAERVLERPDEPAQALATTISAAALAHRGMAAESAALYQWPAPSTSAVPPLVGLGRLDEARRVVGAAVADHPTVDSAARDLMAHGVLDSVTGSAVFALSELLRAAALLAPSGRTALLPDTPAALAALVAINLGELDIAEAVLRGATGGPAERTRHALLLGWIAMLRGEFERARTSLHEAGGRCRTADPRDELFAAAIEIGIARRLGAHTDVIAAWPRARDAVMRYPVDLYVLLPIGEIAVSAARLHADTWLAPHLQGAEALLDGIGRPPLWAAPLHWYGALAAIAAECPVRAAHHASCLRTLAGGTPLADTLAEAAQCWLRVLGGDVDADAVEHAARAMSTAGLVWEAAQLAGQAAIRTTDRRSMGVLLTCARSLRESHDEPAPATPAGRPGAGLSRREVEVAELLVAGMTHREIGEKLFISAKTVEHHVARIRRRIGAGNRADLLAQLKACLAVTRPR